MFCCNTIAPRARAIGELDCFTVKQWQVYSVIETVLRSIRELWPFVTTVTFSMVNK